MEQLKFGRTTCENHSKIANLNNCPILLINVIFSQLQFPFPVVFLVVEANVAQCLLPLVLTLSDHDRPVDFPKKTTCCRLFISMW